MPPQPLNYDKNAAKDRTRMIASSSQQNLEKTPRTFAPREQYSHPEMSNREPRHSRKSNTTDAAPGRSASAGPSQQRRAATQNATTAQMNSPYGGGMMMGGMGMPYGGYGMGYGMGGMMGGGMMGGPMGMLYSVNYFIAMMGQVSAMLGMSVQAIGPLYSMARDSLLVAEKTIRESEVRRWVQRKASRSPLLRWALVLASMLAASQAVRLIRYFIELRMRRSNLNITNPATASNMLTDGSAI